LFRAEYCIAVADLDGILNALQAMLLGPRIVVLQVEEQVPDVREALGDPQPVVEFMPELQCPGVARVRAVEVVPVVVDDPQIVVEIGRDLGRVRRNDFEPALEQRRGLVQAAPVPGDPALTIDPPRLPGGAPLTPTALLEPPEPDLGLVERAAVEEDVPHGLLEAGPLLWL
jgi:hypothetical protein